MGALGPVFRTYEPTRDRLVAVKVFRLDITPEQAQALADQLAHAAEAELFHPSIVEPIAAGVEGSVAYRAEEYVAAESLDVSMRQHAPASMDFVLALVGHLAEAVDVARAAGVGHGALHPRDVFVTSDEARASGFGIVDALERVGIRAPVRRPYSAPERVAGREWSTPADVFSLAAIAFELLTARRPSGTGEDIGPLTGAVGGDAPAVQAVLARAMHEDPEARYASGRDLIEALQAASTAVPASDSTAFPEEPDLPPASAMELDQQRPGSIQMIALPLEAPEFADEDPPAPAVPPAGDWRENRPRLAFGSLRDEDAPEPRPPVERRLAGRFDGESAFAAPLRTAPIEEEPSPDAGLHDAPPPIQGWSSGDREPWTGARAARGDELQPVDDQADRLEIAAERDTDLAQWELSREEAAAEDPADSGTAVRYDDVEVEAAADALVFDAADLALSDRFAATGAAAPADLTTFGAAAPGEREVADRPTDEPAVDEEPVGQRRSFDYHGTGNAQRRFDNVVEETGRIEEPQQVIERDVPPVHGSYADERMSYAGVADVEGARRGAMPLALVLVLGLLVGFAGGYVFGQRRGADQARLDAQPVAASNRETPAAASPRDGSAAASGPSAANGSPPVAQPTVAAAAGAAAAGTAAEARGGAGVAAARTGSLSVRTTPSGAAVTIDGRWSGRTPFTRDALPLGNHDVRIVLPGYQTRREAVTLSASSASRTLNVQLVRDAAARPAVPRPAGRAAAPAAPAAQGPAAATAATGGLEIDSRPAGARVFVDGNAVGTTPLRVADLAPGTHVIRMELPEHRTWTENAQVVRGRTIRVAGSLEPIR